MTTWAVQAAASGPVPRDRCVNTDARIAPPSPRPDPLVKTSEIEGEVLNVQAVRSSIARRMGVDIGAVAPVDRHVEGVVEMVLDATTRASAPLTAERLFGWHAALFPTGYSGLTRIAVGQWRTDAEGPMQVASGHMGRRKVHFQAPSAEVLTAETDRFLAWANADTGEPMLIKAGLAHLWFVTLHPFDDGNGRIARAVWVKARFWQRWAGQPLNERQVKLQTPGGGRSTGYELAD